MLWLCDFFRGIPACRDVTPFCSTLPKWLPVIILCIENTALATQGRAFKKKINLYRDVMNERGEMVMFTNAIKVWPFQFVGNLWNLSLLLLNYKLVWFTKIKVTGSKNAEWKKLGKFKCKLSGALIAHNSAYFGK